MLLVAFFNLFQLGEASRYARQYGYRDLIEDRMDEVDARLRVGGVFPAKLSLEAAGWEKGAFERIIKGEILESNMGDLRRTTLELRLFGKECEATEELLQEKSSMIDQLSKLSSADISAVLYLKQAEHSISQHLFTVNECLAMGSLDKAIKKLVSATEEVKTQEKLAEAWCIFYFTDCSSLITDFVNLSMSRINRIKTDIESLQAKVKEMPFWLKHLNVINNFFKTERQEHRIGTRIFCLKYRPLMIAALEDCLIDATLEIASLLPDFLVRFRKNISGTITSVTEYCNVSGYC